MLINMATLPVRIESVRFHLSVGEINNLDPSKTVVTYCWTGQTSSMITAYLNVLVMMP
jgi:3-mercaptopyruvate sulfurtransferase SseA